MEMKIGSVTDLITAIYSKDLKLYQKHTATNGDKNRFCHRPHHWHL